MMSSEEYYTISALSNTKFTWKDLARFYSENYGIWADTRKPVTLGEEKFTELHRRDNIVLAYTTELLGMMCIEQLTGFISCLVIRKDYRKHGIATELVRWFIELYNPMFLGVASVNPITLHILESIEGYEIYDGIISPIPRFLNGRTIIDHTQVQTNFPVYQDPSEIEGDLLQWYEGWNGKLDIGNEWLIYIKRKIKL